MSVVLLLSIFILSLAGIFLLIRYSKRFGLVDIPNERSVHKKIIPRGAGIVFVISVLLSIFLWDFSHFKTYYYIYIAVLIVFSAGVWDDLTRISPKLKFLFIFIAFLLLYFKHFAIYSLGNYMGYELLLPAWLVFPFTFLQ
jgi:UDP-GlcNAc:undecaprenyl-phosphate GlcNAc-1-phosphate transferase